MNNNVNLNIWGRDFELNIVFQNFPGEEITANQESVVESLNAIAFSESLDAVKGYINKYNSEELGGEEITNIFKYVIPRSVLIPREDDKRVAALMCNYKFDMEHGMAVVFENEKYKAVGPQDIIL
jgi:hypothetical protein